MCVICMRARVCVRECECVLVRTIKCFDIKRLLFAAELNYFANGITSKRNYKHTPERHRGQRERCKRQCGDATLFIQMAPVPETGPPTT